MAEQDQDKAQKTEEPTPKRLEEASRKGQVAKSQEFNHLFMLVAVTLLLLIFASSFMGDIGRIAMPFLESSHNISSDPGNLIRVSREVGIRLMAVLALPVMLLFVAAILSNMMQHKPVFSAEQLIPKLNKVSPMSGAKRLFSPRSLLELAKSIAKFFVIGGVVLIVVYPEKETLTQLMTVSMSQLFDMVQILTIKMLVAVVAVMIFITAIDFWYQKFEHKKNLRMSKQDIKDENKQSEGDPQIKARIRTLRAERARQRMMTAVPNADVVITNPTHFAVALEYDGAVMEAPKLVAKGKNKVAQRIREIAEEHDVPIVENPPLARGIFATVEVGQEVPPEHYKAVAEVIGYVMKVKGQSARQKFTAGSDSQRKTA